MVAKLKDIADATGVSISTVSRVLNGNAPISEETRRKVLETASQMNYHKRFDGKILSRLQNMAGFILPDTESAYYGRLQHAISECFFENNLDVISIATCFSHERTIRAIEHMSQIHVKCIVILLDYVETIPKNILDAVHLTNIPTLFIVAQYMPEFDYDCLYVDEKRGNTMAVDHLVHRGYRRIGFIGEYKTRNRCDIFLNVMKQYAIPVNRAFVRVGEIAGERGGYLLMRDVLSLKEIPDAVFCSYDQMAVGVIHAIYESGLRVPEDIAVIAFDDIPTAQYFAGGITTIATPFEDMASIAVRFLMKRIAQPFGQPQQVAIKPSLIIRATTYKP